FDQPILLLLDKPVIRMSLRNCSQFGFPKQLAEILPLLETHAICQGDDILRQIAIDRLNLPEKPVRILEHPFEPRCEARVIDFRWNTVTVQRSKVLAFLGHHAMAMEIAIRSNIHDDFEP